ncbi:MAG: ribonuclease P protein component [Candidatus Scalindua sp. AMX11]|nr:MAG: ribonuclease P protein component [Candidatus Scalindua sp.]NOG84415.1 ribonuclease P protein component [Planctomycetota bacterium]RZV72468.1 MAG: ribonuclease P protein component [Candidatus Scalindua sp. SCAELEC01]TDE64623.1 MAG: ribonuclease P protein component [Candidatus Scalindua sp. AMX11]GJQ59721.1 MAG: ribonuclease P protein component [Candidatus Scalindua sp.]
MDHRFSKEERLRKRNDFQKVFREGKVFRNDQIAVYALLNNSEISRLGITVGRKFGNAVKRNRLKRIFREAYRLNKQLLHRGVDLIILPRSGFSDLTLTAIEEKLKILLVHIDRKLKDEISSH